MLRRIAIGLCLLATLVVMIPLVSSTAHNLRAQFSSASHRTTAFTCVVAPTSSNAAASSGNAGSASRDARSDAGPAKWNLHQPSRKVAGNHATVPTTVTLLPTASSR